MTNAFQTLLIRYLRLERRAPSPEIGSMITDASVLADVVEKKRSEAAKARAMAAALLESASSLEQEIASGEQQLALVERASTAALDAAELAAALVVPRWRFDLLDALGVTPSNATRN